MNCPKCNVTLLMTDRQGIEIDYCPNCRGVWLDRGELDKIIERSAQTQEHSGPHYPPKQDDPYYKERGYYKHKKNWLSELFD